MNDEVMDMAIKASLRQKTRPINPVDLIDDFEVGAADVKPIRLRRAIWKVYGEDIRKGIVRLVKAGEVIYTPEGNLVLREVWDAVQRGTVLQAPKNYSEPPEEKVEPS